MAGPGPAPRQWGVTPPISSALPSERELELNNSLLEELKRQNNFETPEETEKRTQVLRRLESVTLEFVRHVGRSKGLPPSQLENAGGKVSTFGSYRLGVYGPGSDIDMLIVAPKHVSRDDFFEHFPPLLQTMSAPGAIEEMTSVSDAHVPIIKLEYSGISIDMIFARLAVAAVPQGLDLKDKSLLRGLDETDLRSINGTRVTDEMLDLVPQVKTFRHALRAIKLWAQRRAIYANIMGFPGGVAWAMMVARICQLYPQACGSLIVTRFFHLMGPWPWPRPIMLKHIEEGPLQVRVWNPLIYPGDKRHLMPIITPAYPSMCATHNITQSTKKVILRELERGSVITKQIFDGKKPWSDLFTRHTFFSDGYKYYLSIVAASKDRASHMSWSGLVGSKVRRLVGGIEQSDAGVDIAHPFNKGFDRVHRCRGEEEIDMVCQGTLRFQAPDVQTQTSDAATAVRPDALAQADGADDPPADGASGIAADDGVSVIYTTTYYVGIELMEGFKTLDISFPVGDFKRQCTEWADYNPDVQSIRIVHTRNYDLPDDVFEPGETRPTRSRKPKAKKRSIEDAGLEAAKSATKRHQTMHTNGAAAT